MLRYNHKQLRNKNRLPMPDRQGLATPRKPSRIKRLIVRFNLLHPVCNAMFGKDHSLLQRLLVGAAVAASGVATAKFFGHSEIEALAFAGDAVGYGLHGLGLAPYIEWAIRTFEETA